MIPNVTTIEKDISSLRSLLAWHQTLCADKLRCDVHHEYTAALHRVEVLARIGVKTIRRMTIQ